MDPVALEKAFELYPDVKLVVSAELYGFPGRMDVIKSICEKNGALLIEDAAEAIEEFFKNIGKEYEFTALIKGNSQEFNITIEDEGKKEATIKGTTTFSCVDSTLKVTLTADYTEFEDDGKTIDESFTLDVSLTVNILDIKDFNEIDLTKLGSFTVKVDGIEVWKDAFSSALD